MSPRRSASGSTRSSTMSATRCATPTSAIPASRSKATRSSSRSATRTDRRGAQALGKLDPELTVDIAADGPGTLPSARSRPSAAQSGRRAVDRDHPPPHRRDRHQGADDPARGQRPHPGPAPGHRQSRARQGAARQDRQADLPAGRHRRLAGRRARSGRLPPGDEILPAEEGRARRVGPSRLCRAASGSWSAATRWSTPSRPSRTTSRSSASASTPTAPGASATRPARMSASRFAIVLDNKVISAPVIREPILGGSASSPAASRSSRRAIWRCCCAPARCRRRSRSSRSARSVPISAPIRSMPARPPASSASSSSSSS